VNGTNGYLLDSHGLLWWWFEPQRLSPTVASLLQDSSSPVHVSAASIWELSIKHHLGRLPQLAGAIGDLEQLLRADGFRALAITPAHGLRAGAYSQPHRDPFDRMCRPGGTGTAGAAHRRHGAAAAFGWSRRLRRKIKATA